MNRSPPPLESTDVFEILAHPRRRHLIALLDECDTADRLFLDTLSTRLAEREDTMDESVDDIAVTLHHHHLPKLDEVGLVEYDPRIKMVEFTGRFDDRPVADLEIVSGDD